MTHDETLRVRVNQDLKVELQKLAEQDKRKLSDYVRVQLEKLVENSKKKAK